MVTGNVRWAYYAHVLFFILGVFGNSVFASPEAHFIANLKAKYLTQKAKEEAVIGIEIEFNGLTEEKTIEIIQKTLGGRVDGAYVRDTVIGDVRVYRDGTMWNYDDWARTQNEGKESRLRRLWYAIKDALQAPVEIVFEPRKYQELAWIEKLTEALAEAGGHGPKGLATGATHFNLQVDPTNARLLKNILGNYTNNGKLFRAYYRPALMRRLGGFLKQPEEQLKIRLGDYDYLPTAQEFWMDFRDGAHIKLSRVNIGPAMLSDLSVSADEKKKLIEEGWGQRPAVELREANTFFGKGYLTENVDVGLALIEASKETGFLNPTDLETSLKVLPKGAPVAPGTAIWDHKFQHSLTGVLGKDHFVKVKLKKLPNAKVSYVDQRALQAAGIVPGGMSLSELKQKFGDRFSFEVVRPGEDAASAVPGEEVVALAYNDGYLGRGDGRASWTFEHAVPGRAVYDFGTKGTGLTVYGIPQESIDAGFHIGEKDGYLSLEEAVHVLQTSWMLNAIGIESERIAGIVETGKQTGFNLDPPKPQPAAVVVRYFDNGLRGAHLRMYDKETLKKVVLFLRQREAIRLGRQNELPPTEVYITNKLQRDARRAALAQHFWVVHGAINTANIFENGWADLYYAQAASIPDPAFAPLNVYSRLGYQSQEFFKVAKEFAEYVASTDSSVNVDVKKVFWDTYNKELARLELVSAGFDPAMAERLVDKKPQLADEYRDLIWSLNYEHLITNTRALKRLVPLVVKNNSALLLSGDGRGIPTWFLQGLAKRKGDIQPERVFVEEMFRKDRLLYKAQEWWERLTGQVPDRKTEASAAKLIRLAELTRELAVYATALDGNVKLRDMLMQMQKQASRIADLDLPTAPQIHEKVEAYLANGGQDLNAFLTEMSGKMEKLESEVKATYGDLHQSARSSIGKVDVALTTPPALPPSLAALEGCVPQIIKGGK